MQNHIAKHFALQLGSLVSLYLSIGFFLALLFGVITLQFPDAADSSWQFESARDSIRIGFAMVIVFFPAYLVLTRVVNKSRRLANSSEYLGLTKWLIYLSLLVGGGVLLGDLVAIIYAFLEGDITTRFLLKALSVLVVTGLAFYYYVRDAQGYWVENEKASLVYGAATSLIVLVSLIVSLQYIETPAEVREANIDERQVADLQEIQWRIEDHLRANGVLPESIDELYTVHEPPAAPADRAAYRFEVTDTGFNLCAEFGTTSDGDDYYYGRPLPVTDSEMPYIQNPNDWEYQQGKWCFARRVVTE